MIGERISHYKILERLGSGGMGIVYRALDENLGRDVAIKVLHREVMHDPDRLSRFEREAKAIAKLAHPNILAIHDFGNIGGIAFAVTELLEGETVGQRLAREHLPWRKAVAIAASIAEGLAAAHAKGITHRDIKPDNIFITTDGRVKILDFGLAHTGVPQVVDPLAPTLSVPFMDEPVMGTVAYMAPEQLRGEAVDARSDIFTLGCVIYEMLTARRAFSKGSFALTVTAILMDPAPEVHVSGVEATLELNRIIGRCLEKNPMERFQSASDLAFALRSLLTEKPGVHALTEAMHSNGADSAKAGAKIQKRKDTPGYSGMKGKWLSHVLIPVALLCILAVAVALWISSDREITLAVLPSENEAPDKSGWDESLAQKLNTKISELEIIKVRPLLTRKSLSGMGSDFVGIAKKFQVSALLRWNYRLMGEDLEIYVELIDGRTGNAESKTFFGKSNLLMDTITQIARHVVEKLRPRLGPAEMDRLECVKLYGKGRDALASRSPDSLRKAIQYFEEALKKNQNYALAYVGIADSYNMLGLYGLEDPRKVFPLGKDAANKAIAIDNSLAEAHTSLGFAIERHDFNRQLAQQEYDRAIQNSSANRDARAAAYHRYGVCLIDLGQYPQAIEKLQLAQKDDPSSQIMMCDMARAYLFQGDLKKAILISVETIARFPTFAPAYRYRGLAYEQEGDFKRAIRDIEQAMKLSNNSPLMKGDLGHVYASAGQKDKAMLILSELQQERNNGNYRSCFLIAQIYASLDERAPALKYLKQALEEKDPFLLSLEVDPIFKKKLGNDPEFKQITEQLAQR